MKIFKEKQIECSHCSIKFFAKRQDLDSRCKNCRKRYLQDWSELPGVIKRKSEIHREIRERAFSGYGGKCQCCEEGKFEFLAIDHVNGGGRKDRKKHSTRQIAKRVIDLNFPPEYRVLCHNCNLSIGFFGYCPHWKRTV